MHAGPRLGGYSASHHCLTLRQHSVERIGRRQTASVPEIDQSAFEGRLLEPKESEQGRSAQQNERPANLFGRCVTASS